MAMAKTQTKTSLSKAGIEARRDTESGRFYEIEEQLLPSVTNIDGIIAKPLLVPWAAKQERLQVMEASANLYEDLAKCPPMSRAAYLATLEGRIGKEKAAAKQLAKAGEIGSQAHKLIEWNLRKAMGQEVGPEPRVSDAALWAFMSCQDWIKKVELKPLYMEQVVYHLGYGYAGTMDLLAEITHKNKRVTALIDWKTGKAIYPESSLQAAAYREALRYMRHTVPDICLIVRLPKVETDPEFELKMVEDPDRHFQAFLHALELWKWREKMKA